MLVLTRWGWSNARKFSAELAFWGIYLLCVSNIGFDTVNRQNEGYATQRAKKWFKYHEHPPCSIITSVITGFCRCETCESWKTLQLIICIWHRLNSRWRYLSVIRYWITANSTVLTAWLGYQSKTSKMRIIDYLWWESTHCEENPSLMGKFHSQRDSYMKSVSVSLRPRVISMFA